ncbi:MAG: Gfo/Idh/MocA family oxidoreductase [Fimbriimonadaceae bacterium]|nr:Gfo/Idh/MocA family oxidoreductase [Fimbriimonadaceae bacterium]
MARTRLALIGCGGMSRAHAGRFFNLADRLEVVAAVDVDLAKARAAAEVLPGAQPATDYREVLADVDAALLVLPHHLHHPVALDCLAAGKHVLVEKPLANSEAECRELIAAAQAAQRTLMVAYCMRFHPLVVRMKQLLDAQELGEVFQVSIWTEQHTQVPPDHWASSARTLGGGQLFSHGCHYIDLLLWYLGRPVRGTHLGTNYGTPWMEREGTSNVSLEFESGALGYHFGTWGAKGTRLKYSFHAHCTGGLLDARITEGAIYRIVGGEEQKIYDAEVGKHTENEMAHFLDCLETGAIPLTNGPESVQGLKVIWRLYEAEEQGVVADLRGCGLDQYCEP